MKDGRLAGFVTEPNGDVWLTVYTGPEMIRVLFPRDVMNVITSLAKGYDDAEKARKVSQEPEHTYYVQVRATPRSHTLTYKSTFQIPVGSMVTLPPLPWMKHNWTTTVIGINHGNVYDGVLKNVISANIPQKD